MKVITHLETKWLILLKVIARVLQLWPAFVSYFHSHLDAEKHGRVQTIKSQLCDEIKLLFTLS